MSRYLGEDTAGAKVIAMAKRVTVDQLAVIVVNGFQTLQDEMRGGFKTLRDEMLGRFAAVEDDLKNVKVELKDLRTDVGRIERKLNT